jgi:crotonobetainyl-CoA:carnitine CoA-transferase CaiB-like acyl-CoA transferase
MIADFTTGTGPLGHLKILDLSDEKGHACGKFLADMGALVIKVEPPEGDKTRHRGPYFHNKEDTENSLSWFNYNTNKKSITLDITKPEGKQVLEKLVGKTDILVESYPPRYLEQLSLGYEQLKNINPEVIMTSITAFGQSGPYADYIGNDLIAWAMSGFMYTCGEADRPPVRCSVEQAYVAAGVQAATASLFALHYRNLTGKGQHVDIAMRECLPSGGFEIFFWETEEYIGERLGVKRRRGNIYVRDLWPCKDGYIGWRLMTGPLGARSAYLLVEWMDNEGMAGGLKDIKWETIDMNQLDNEQMERWESIIISFLKRHTKQEIYDMAFKKGMQMTPEFNADELMHYKQLIERNFWTDVAYPHLDSHITHPGAFCLMSESPLVPPLRAPHLGEHNREIYTGELGYTEQDLIQLQIQGTI